jgi:hypothetical protein
VKKVRSIDVCDWDAALLVQFLEDFLTKDRVDSRLCKISRELQIERGLYRDIWARARNSFWLGFDDLRQHLAAGKDFRGAVTARMRRPLEVAAKLRVLTASMPDSKTEEFRSRITGQDAVEPVLYELDMAAHFWQKGYDIHWCEADRVTGQRSPEFIAKGLGHEFEVECKHQSADAGRQVLRRFFYRLLDDLQSHLATRRITGKVLITIPSRLPKNNQWMSSVVNLISGHLGTCHETLSLHDGTQITLDTLGLHATESLVPVDAVLSELQSIRGPFSHFALWASGEEKGVLLNPIIVRVESRTDDRILSSVYNDLKDARKQFTRQRCGLICCFIPEIDSFADLEENSALCNMTREFLQNHCPDFVHAVCYTSESRVITVDSLGDTSIITTAGPTITFYNEHYDERYGSRFRPFERLDSTADRLGF